MGQYVIVEIPSKRKKHHHTQQRRSSEGMGFFGSASDYSISWPGAGSGFGSGSESGISSGDWRRGKQGAKNLYKGIKSAYAGGKKVAGAISIGAGKAVDYIKDRKKSIDAI